MDQVQINPAEWSEEAGAVLAPAIPYGSVSDLEMQIKHEGAKLFEVIAENAGRVGFYVLRIDKNASGFEGVIVAGAGSLRGVDLVELVVPAMEKQFMGCASVRVHTARPGLAKKLAGMGYGAGEIVLRKKLQ